MSSQPNIRNTFFYQRSPRPPEEGVLRLHTQTNGHRDSRAQWANSVKKNSTADNTETYKTVFGLSSTGQFYHTVIVWDEYSDIQIYLNIFGRIYSFVLIFVDFFQAEYIRIFICHLFILTNIFGYSFGQYL